MKHPLTVTGMTCGHCEKSVTRTVLRWDPQAQVHIDRAHNRVNVDTDKDITPLLALIATVGLGMNHAIGTAARLFQALAKARVNVRLIDQGSSEQNIIVGVEEGDLATTIRAIYNEFA
jgi:aspartate kinase